MKITEEHRIAQSWCLANGYKFYPVLTMGRYKIIREFKKRKTESKDYYFDKTKEKQIGWSDKIWDLMLKTYRLNKKNNNGI